MKSLDCDTVQIEARELQAEAEREMREMEIEKTREAERQKKLEEAAAKQRAREKEIEEREVSPALADAAVLAACPLLCRLPHNMLCLFHEVQYNAGCMPFSYPGIAVSRYMHESQAWHLTKPGQGKMCSKCCA